MSGRTDIHRPADFDPADYRVIDYLDNKKPEPPDPRYATPRGYELYEKAVAAWKARIFEHFPEWRTSGIDHSTISQCNHCGAHIRWVAVVEHIPTGGRLAFGEICAERTELPNQSAFRAKFIKDRAALEAARLENEIKRETFRLEHGDVVDYLEKYAALEIPSWERDYDEFIDSLARQLVRKGELSERQVGAVRSRIQRKLARESRRAMEAAAAGPFQTGRLQLEGEVVSVKVQDGFYGLTVKMLVKLDDGNKVWGTVPRNIEEQFGSEISNTLRGRRVHLTATVERSDDDDEHFGFYSRPTKAEVL